MHPRVMAERRATAQERMSAAVGVLSHRFGVQLEDRPPVRAADQWTAALFGMEQIATFLDALVVATDASEPEKPAKAPARKA